MRNVNITSRSLILSNEVFKNQQKNTKKKKKKKKQQEEKDGIEDT